jgi:hypothetical protein
MTLRGAGLSEAACRRSSRDYTLAAAPECRQLSDEVRWQASRGAIGLLRGIGTAMDRPPLAGLPVRAKRFCKSADWLHQAGWLIRLAINTIPKLHLGASQRGQDRQRIEAAREPAQFALDRLDKSRVRQSALTRRRRRQLPAISCLGASRTPVVPARGWIRHPGVRET